MVEKTRINILPQAKMLLHAIKNPNSQIGGILLGTEDGVVTDVLPVCHNAPTKPILDWAFRMAEVYGVGSVMGWYTSNERLEDSQPNQASLRIMQSISGRNVDTEPVLVAIDNVKFGKYLVGQEKSSFDVYGRDARKHWLRPLSLELEERDEFASKILDSQVNLYDFEDHLESVGKEQLIEKDWLRNEAVAKFIRA